MKEILNPEQFEKFQQHFKKRAKMRKNRGGELPTETPED
jgi:Spy/CpxP family protein refolding chaperone